MSTQVQGQRLEGVSIVGIRPVGIIEFGTDPSIHTTHIVDEFLIAPGHIESTTSCPYQVSIDGIIVADISTNINGIASLFISFDEAGCQICIYFKAESVPYIKRRIDGIIMYVLESRQAVA